MDYMDFKVSEDGRKLVFTDKLNPDVSFTGSHAGLWVQVGDTDNCIPWSNMETLINYLRTVRARSTT